MLTNVQVLAGATSVARFDDVVVWFETGPDGGGTMIDQVFEAVRRVAEGTAPSRGLGARLASVLNSGDTKAVPALVAATPEGDGLRVVVHGWGSVVADGIHVPNGWVDQVISDRRTFFLGRNTASPLAPVDESPLDLEDGVVPGDGVSFALAVAPFPGAASTPSRPLPAPPPAAPAPAPSPASPAPGGAPPWAAPAPAAAAWAPPAAPVAAAPPPPASVPLPVDPPAYEPPPSDPPFPAAGPPPGAAGPPPWAVPGGPGPVPPLAAGLPAPSPVGSPMAPPPAPAPSAAAAAGPAWSAPPVAAPAPPGRLVLDDGRSAVLERTCILGSAPHGSPAVQTGVAMPLTVMGVGVAPVHAEIRVEPGSVAVRDLGSAPTYVLAPGATTWAPLAPGQISSLLPGGRIAMGQRTLSYEHP